jgi:hypothetical protein
MLNKKYLAKMAHYTPHLTDDGIQEQIDYYYRDARKKPTVAEIRALQKEMFPTTP